jgi:predicted Zn-dependent protease
MEQGPPKNGPQAEPPPTAFGGRARSTSTKVRDAILLLAGLLITVYLVLAGGRFLAGWLATRLPYSVDQSIGEFASEQFTSTDDVCTNPVLVNAVEGIIKTLGTGLDDDFQPLKITVVNNDQINAFALPGGFMFVNTGLLQKIESPEELIGVLGHEIGHVVNRHGIKRIGQSIWLQILMATIFGDIGTIAEAGAAHATLLIDQSFDRDQESESDQFGLDLMLKTGYAPKNFPAFFERLPDSGVHEWFSTHPDPERRAKELRARLAEIRFPSDQIWVQPPTLEQLQAPCFSE